MRYLPVKIENMRIGDIIVKDYTKVGEIAQIDNLPSNSIRLTDINPKVFNGETVNKGELIKMLKNNTLRLLRKENNSVREMADMFKRAGLELTESEKKILKGE